ncbi:hypothetical protein FW774_16850 [Pedobacter sp. BS3]|uniref:hypothetical protein n=1 Tax=Pedobacter sp. BS3 TaxID=2567937 RepID=UPI0011F05FDB|nr:hypothetical protein [Pedobacter sp. BS3]TZF81724.1 hypothetical protein FW774_16850 [Pedobacter sp. BS3]
MKLLFISCMFLGWLSAVSVAMAQDTTAVKDNTLRGQYLYMLSKSNNYQGYKVINQSRLAALWKNFSDTLSKARAHAAQLQNKLNEQQQVIADLKNNMANKDKTLAESNAMVNEIKFLGIPINKGTYSTIMWLLVFALAAVLAFFVFQGARHRKEARYRIKLFEELSEEYQNHKIRANEKEKKLARELQDERNKLDEYMSRGIR